MEVKYVKYIAPKVKSIVAEYKRNGIVSDEAIKNLVTTYREYTGKSASATSIIRMFARSYKGSAISKEDLNNILTHISLKESFREARGEGTYMPHIGHSPGAFGKFTKSSSSSLSNSETGFIREMLPLYKKALGGREQVSDISRIDDALKGKIVSTYEKYFHETVPMHKAIERFTAVYKKKYGKLPNLSRFVTKNKIKTVGQRAGISAKNIATSVSASSSDENSASLEKGRAQAVLSSIFEEGVKTAGIAAQSSIVGKIMSKKLNKYLAESYNPVMQYLEEVTKYDEYARFGKAYKIDEKIKEKVVTLHQKYFGKMSESDPNKIVRDYMKLLQKHNAKKYVSLRTHIFQMQNELHATLLNEVSTPVVTGGLLIEDRDKKVAKGVSDKVKDSKKAGSDLKTALLKPDSMISKSTAKGIGAKAVKATGVSAKGIATGMLSVAGMMAPDKETAKAINQTNKKLSKTLAFARFMKNWRANLTKMRTVGIVAKAVTSLFARIAIQVISGILSLLGYLAPVIVIIVVVFAVIYPALLYGGLTHLSQDVAINETYAYETYIPARVMSEYQSTEDGSGSPTEQPPASVKGVVTYQSSEGFLYTVSDTKEEEEMIRKFDPMIYISLLSAYYTTFSFPKFKDDDDPNKPTVDVRSCPLFNLNHLFVIQTLNGHGNSPYHDAFGHSVAKSKVKNYLYEIDYDVKNVHLFDFLYKWWYSARKQYIRHKNLLAALKDAKVKVQLGYIPEKEYDDLNKQLQKDESAGSQYYYYFGDKGATRMHFNNLLNPKINEVGTSISKLKSYNYSIDNVIDSMISPACTLYCNSTTGGAYYECNTCTDKNGNSFMCCSYHSGCWGGNNHPPHRGDEGGDGRGDGGRGGNSRSCPVDFEEIANNEKTIIDALFKQAESDGEKAKKALIKIRDTFGKTQQLDQRGNLVWMDSGEGWYTDGELTKESGQVDQTLTLLLKYHDDIEKLVAKIQQYSAYWGGLPGSYPEPAMCSAACYHNPSWSNAASRLSSRANTLSNEAMSIKNVWKSIYKDIMTIDYSCYLVSHFRPTSSVTVGDILSKASDDEKPYIQAVGNNYIYVWILSHALSVDNINKVKNKELKRRLKNAREMFIQIYNPYGMLFKAELNMHFLDDISSEIVEYHKFGYFFDPIAYYDNNFESGCNPANTPPDFNGSASSYKSFFTTATYTQKLFGLISQNKVGFIDTRSNWEKSTHEVPPLFRGDVITNRANLSIGGGGHGSFVDPFEVHAPIAGTVHIKYEDGQPVVYIIEMYESEYQGKKQRLLDNSVILRGLYGIEVSDGQKVDSSTVVGKAYVLEIDYTKQADLYYEYLGGHIMIPRDISFYNVPHIYFDWEGPMQKAVEQGGG